MANTPTALPNAEVLKDAWAAEADDRGIKISFGVQEFKQGEDWRRFLYATYPLKGNAPFGLLLLAGGWEVSQERFGGTPYYDNTSRTSKRIMLTQYRIQVQPKEEASGPCSTCTPSFGMST